MKHSGGGIDVLVIGAGISGLAAAKDLAASGYSVLVVEKGRGVGGRMATRRFGGAVFDHGAQFITVRETRFDQKMNQWLAESAATEWFHTTPDGRERTRYRGMPAMTGVAKHLAEGLSVRLSRRVVSIREAESGWIADFSDGQTVSAAKIVLTAPVPQALEMVDEIALEPDTEKQLNLIEYDRCIAVMAVLDGPSAIPEPGYVRPGADPVEWVADNQLKGVSPMPAVTLHAGPAFSKKHWEEDRTEVGRHLLEKAAPVIDAPVVDFQVHGWKYAKPIQKAPVPFVELRSAPSLLVAGDAFGGARVEGAALSGWAAAAHIISGTQG